MLQKPSPSELDVIACEICLTEIPRDLVCCEEAVEYVQYFCGYTCFAQWQQEADRAFEAEAVRR